MEKLPERKGNPYHRHKATLRRGAVVVTSSRLMNSVRSVIITSFEIFTHPPGNVGYRATYSGGQDGLGAVGGVCMAVGCRTILRMMIACSESRQLLPLRRKGGIAAPCGEYGVDHCSASVTLHGPIVSAVGAGLVSSNSSNGDAALISSPKCICRFTSLGQQKFWKTHNSPC